MFAAAATVIATPGLAQRAPTDILPKPAPAASSAPRPTATSTSTPKSSEPAAKPTPRIPYDAPTPTASAPAPAPSAAPSAAVSATPPQPVVESVMAWPVRDAQALLTVIEAIGDEGLIPADYKPDELRRAIAQGPGQTLDDAASKSFSWLVEDLRDGRTPMTARLQWFVVDPDQDENPTMALMAKALQTHDIAGVLNSLAPTHLDFQALKTALAETPKSDTATRKLIRANMDRWRWLKRDLGTLYLITNVPEYQLRLMVRDRVIRSYKTVVGKPGRTATPQLAEEVEAVVFNPTWTVPQSIVRGEGLGARLLANPGSARAQGYRVSRNADGFVTVVQQPGKNNALGLMKIDMPNPHAIYLHDTPSKQTFNLAARAYSHGCIRTERAVELGMTMGMLGAGLTEAQATEYSNSGKYTRVKMTQTFPVYITYFTMGRDLSGGLMKFNDLYGRDKAVLDSFEKPRKEKTTQRSSAEEVIKLDNPL